MYSLRMKGPLFLIVLLAGCGGGGENKEDTGTLPWSKPDRAKAKPIIPPIEQLEPKKANGSQPDKTEVTHIDSFLGISPDFKTYATADKGVRLVDRQTGRQMLPLAWDKNWGSPQAAAFGRETVAVIAGRYSDRAVKVFSSQTGELTQNAFV
jgi:hypothetical protein